MYYIVGYSNYTLSIILWNNHSGPYAYLHLQLLRVSTWELRVLRVALLVTRNHGLENPDEF